MHANPTPGRLAAAAALSLLAPAALAVPAERETLVAVTFEPGSNPDDAFADLRFPALGDGGQVAFVGGFGIGVGDRESGVFLADTPLVREVGREGRVLSGTSQVLDDLRVDFVGLAVDDAGRVAFNATLAGGGLGLFVGDADSAVVVAREGGQLPGGPGGVVTSLSAGVDLNDLGQRSFVARLDDGPRGLFRGDGTTTTRLVSAGNDALKGAGRFSSFGEGGGINDRGRIAVRSRLLGVGSAIDTGVYLFGGDAPVEVAREGQATPGGPGEFRDFLDFFNGTVSLNDAGQVLFPAFLEGDGVDADNNFGLYLYDDDLGLLEVARDGGIFADRQVLRVTSVGELNDRGQVAFTFDSSDGRTNVGLWSVPEPSGAGVLAGAAVLLTRRRRGGR